MNKADILRWAIESGCDTDGDMLYINGKKYYVHITKKIVEEVERSMPRKLAET